MTDEEKQLAAALGWGRRIVETGPAMPEREAIARLDRLASRSIAEARAALPTTGDVREAAPEREAVRTGPCDHQWGYMTATGGISCSKCLEARPHTDPEAIKVREQ
jgi:hypothetical protein